MKINVTMDCKDCGQAFTVEGSVDNIARVLASLLRDGDSFQAVKMPEDYTKSSIAQCVSECLGPRGVV